MNTASRFIQEPPPLKPAYLEPVELSHSKKTTMQRCGRAYRYKYVDRLGTKLMSSNLGYGACVHKGTAATLTSQALAGVVLDPVPVFVKAWKEFVLNNAIEFSADWDDVSLEKTGREVLQRFMVDWVARGWSVVCDVEGIPVIERELKVQLPGNIVYTAILDALVRTPDGRILVLDFKTPRTVSQTAFVLLSDQQLGHQVVCEAHASSLGIDRVDGAVFYELTKLKVPTSKSRGEGPQIHISDIIPRRSQDDVADWIRELQFVANDIRNERYTRRPTDAFSSTCVMCPFAIHCRGEFDPNLYQRAPRRNRAVELTLVAEQVPF